MGVNFSEKRKSKSNKNAVRAKSCSHGTIIQAKIYKNGAFSLTSVTKSKLIVYIFENARFEFEDCATIWNIKNN